MVGVLGLIKASMRFKKLRKSTADANPPQKPDQKEAFNMASPPKDQPLPPPLASQTAQVNAFTSGCHSLCNQILTLLATALKMPDQSWFAERHDYGKQNSSILRLLYYPSPEPDESGKNGMRAGAHSDYGSVTLLFRLPGQPGLEILTKDGTWAPVPVDPLPLTANSHATTSGRTAGHLPILVNIGDVLEYWTNGLLKSTVHRVVLPEDGAEDRYSIAYFCHPDDGAELVEVPSLVVRGVGRETREGVKRVAGVRTAREHLDARLAATYGLG